MLVVIVMCMRMLLWIVLADEVGEEVLGFEVVEMH